MAGPFRSNTERTNAMKLVEPPSCGTSAALVFIGRNSSGQWVAQEQNGLFGGLFVDRTQAIKYALFENGRHPEAIVELARAIELDTEGRLAPVGLLLGAGKQPVP